MRYSYLSLASFLAASEAFAFNPAGSSSTRSTFSPPQQTKNNKSSDGGALYGFGLNAIETLLFRPTIKTREAFPSLYMADGADALFGGNVPGMPDKVPPIKPHNEENPMGGEKFKKMLERAKQDGAKRMASSSTEQLQAPTPPAVQPPQNAPQATDPQQLYYQAQLQAWQQQMVAYTQLITTNPEAAAQMAPPPPPTPPIAGVPSQPQVQQTQGHPMQYSQPQPTDAPVAYAPKPATKKANKDAFEISNTADVYFAQLKRDSTVRTEARKAGDLDTANAAFKDEGVQALSNYLSDDLIAKRRAQVAESGGEFETSRDEMIIPYAEEEEGDKTNSGVSYREKLKDNMRGQDEKINTDTPPVGQTKQMNNFFPKPAEIVIDSPVLSKEESAQEEVQTQTAGEEESSQRFALESKDESEIAMIAAPSMEDSEDTRRIIRESMGLILKHRGGTGFGHGRLKSPETERLVTSINDVLSILKSETNMSDESSTIPSAEVTSPATIVDTTPTRESTLMSTLDSEPLTGAFACVEAALSMYRSAPSNEQGKLLAPVRDALLSAATTINDVAEGWEIKELEKNKDQETPTTMSFPDYDAEPEVSNIEIEDNTSKLTEIYEGLKGIQGSEKYGLRELESGEASHVSVVLKEMRGILMEELEA